jgi:hypothetical protein
VAGPWGTVKYRSIAPTPRSRPPRDRASMLRIGVFSTSRSWKAGHRRASNSSVANTGIPLVAASRHGPRPTVNCNRSTAAANSLLAASGVRRSGPPWTLNPTPSTGSTAAVARANRSGSRSGSSPEPACAASIAFAKPPTTSTPVDPPINSRAARPRLLPAPSGAAGRVSAKSAVGGCAAPQGFAPLEIVEMCGG